MILLSEGASLREGEELHPLASAMLNVRAINKFLGTSYSVEEYEEKDALWLMVFDAVRAGLHAGRRLQGAVTPELLDDLGM